jgi:hypothetical protein
MGQEIFTDAPYVFELSPWRTLSQNSALLVLYAYPSTSPFTPGSDCCDLAESALTYLLAHIVDTQAKPQLGHVVLTPASAQQTGILPTITTSPMADTIACGEDISPFAIHAYYQAATILDRRLKDRTCLGQNTEIEEERLQVLKSLLRRLGRRWLLAGLSFLLFIYQRVTSSPPVPPILFITKRAILGSVFSKV